MAHPGDKGSSRPRLDRGGTPAITPRKRPRDPGPFAAWLRLGGFKYDRKLKVKDGRWVCKNGSGKRGTR